MVQPKDEALVSVYLADFMVVLAQRIKSDVGVELVDERWIDWDSGLAIER